MLTWSFGCTGFLEPSSPPRSSIARFEMTCAQTIWLSSRSERWMLETHLVDVHVGLSAAAGLEDDEREVVDELARDDLCEMTSGIQRRALLEAEARALGRVARVSTTTTDSSVIGRTSSAAVWMASATLGSRP